MIHYGHTFHISLPAEQGYDIALADRWLNEVLRLAPHTSSISDDPAQQRLSRMLMLIPVFLEMGQIASFQPGRILSWEAGPHGGYDARIFVPHSGLIPQQPIRAAVKGAAIIIDWLGRNPLNEKNRQELFSHIENKIRRSVRPDFLVGKSTLQVLRSAHSMDIPFIHLGKGLYQLGWGSRGHRFERSSCVADSAIGTFISTDKVHSAELLNLAGLPTPQHHFASNLNEACSAAAKLGWPLVAKPRNRDGGVGVTVGINSEDALKEAYAVAHRASPKSGVIIERQVPGTCHRLFIAAGRLLYAVKRMPKSVCGDGCNSVSTLVRLANAEENARPPWLRTEPYPVDDAALAAISAAGYGWESVPEAGNWVPLRAVESTQWGGRDEDVTQTLHPDNLEIALAASRQLGLEVAGVDIISIDITQPWHQNGAIINEVNYAPLLGGGAISRSHLPEFIARFVKEDGRIPVDVVVGHDAEQLALERHRHQVASGRRSFFSSETRTLDHNGKEMNLTCHGLSLRCLALLMDSRAEALVLHIRTDELLQRTLPIDRIETLIDAQGPLSSWADPHREADPKRRQMLFSELLAIRRK